MAGAGFVGGLQAAGAGLGACAGCSSGGGPSQAARPGKSAGCALRRGSASSEARLRHPRSRQSCTPLHNAVSYVHSSTPSRPQALCLACGSDPDKGTQKKMGAYVMKTCFQTTTVSSAMWGPGG
jgi:hypothetical protein